MIVDVTDVAPRVAPRRRGTIGLMVKLLNMIVDRALWN